ncbi:MAG: hypothetical protein WKF35_08145 [Ferruginibacter sp.]
MKKILLSIITITALSFSAFAQSTSSDEMKQSSERRERQKDRINPRLLEQIGLSAIQNDQIKMINEDYRSKMQEMIKSEIPVEDRKSKRASLENDKKNKIMAVLTAEQLMKLKELQSKEINVDGETKDKIKTDDGKIKVKSDDEKTKIKIKSDQ